MKPTIYDTIRKFLKGKKWTFAGVIEDHIRAKLGTKGVTSNRRMQEMCSEGVLEVKYVLFNSRMCKLYKLK
jgi:hypothetical protein